MTLIPLGMDVLVSFRDLSIGHNNLVLWCNILELQVGKKQGDSLLALAMLEFSTVAIISLITVKEINPNAILSEIAVSIALWNDGSQINFQVPTKIS